MEPIPLVDLGSSPFRYYFKVLQMILTGSQDWEPLSGGKNMGSGLKIVPLTAVSPWENHFISLSIGFLVRKMGIILSTQN